LIVVFRRIFRRAAEDVRSKLGEGRILVIDESANSFGLGSKGVTQIRGNGCLGASDDEVIFVMWLPRRELRIPRHRITSVDRARSHLGKTVGRPLLRIAFTNDDGHPDTIALLVSDLEAWESALRSG
jgi:hypothetical protein